MNWLPSFPAHAGLTPKPLRWHEKTIKLPKDDPLGHFLAQKSIKNLQIWQLETNLQFPFGFFRVQGEYQYQSINWFVKLVTPSQASRQLKANQLCVFLQQRGVETVCLLENLSIPLSEKVVSLVSNFKEFRFGDVDDLDVLALAVGDLHQSMLAYPFAKDVKLAAKGREQVLLKRWKDIQQVDSHQTIPKEALQILKTHTIDFACLTEHAQVVHGDLNVGNILFQHHGKIAFIDFEDSQTAWFSPLVELAFVIERFLLIDEIEDKFVTKAVSFLKSYPLILHFPTNTILVEILQCLAIRSMLLLAELVYTNQNVANSEWQKFVYLYSLAEQKRPNLIAIVESVTKNK